MVDRGPKGLNRKIKMASGKKKAKKPEESGPMCSKCEGDG